MGGRVGRIDRRHLAVLEGFGPVVTGLQRLQRLGRDRVAENEVFDADFAIVTSRSDEGVFARLDFGDVRFVVVREMLGIALDGDSPNEGSLDSSLPTRPPPLPGPNSATSPSNRPQNPFHSPTRPSSTVPVSRALLLPDTGAGQYGQQRVSREALAAV
ncbi:hypothetical protein DVR14_15950 [Natrinema thermotolerans]|nr:hypothetical protein DVR14_15950 [Natrinema thermotolerans]